MVNRRGAAMQSMTGFATRRGQGLGQVWHWELRGVNGKGLDLRLRLPEGIEGLEPALRARLAARLSRGHVSLTLRLARDPSADPLRLNPAVLGAVLTALDRVGRAAVARGITLAPTSAAEILALRGVLDAASVEDEDMAPLRAALLADLDPLLDAFVAARRAEGAALSAVIAARIDRIEALTHEARAEAAARAPAVARTLAEALARVTAEAQGIDPARIAQELALIALRQDVAEELDRLTAHVAQARRHLADPDPVGRKLDFLMQEFLREANTLCSKSQSAGLTRIGLDLKTAIDQMREQVQNVE